MLTVSLPLSMLFALNYYRIIQPEKNTLSNNYTDIILFIVHFFFSTTFKYNLYLQCVNKDISAHFATCPALQEHLVTNVAADVIQNALRYFVII